MKKETLMDTESGLSVTEAGLGKTLALLHRALARIDDSAHAEEVQLTLERAVSCLENARRAHAQSAGLPVYNIVHGGASAEVVAAIAAAVSTVIEGPHRLLKVQKTKVPTPASSAWAMEGRAQIFRSHKVR